MEVQNVLAPIAIVASVVATISSVITGYVVLYVKAQIAPIVERVKHVECGFADHSKVARADKQNIWSEVGALGQRVSALEAVNDERKKNHEHA